MCQAAARHDLDLVTKSELFEESDFYDFDLILCMDRERMRELRARQKKDSGTPIILFRWFETSAAVQSLFAVNRSAQIPHPGLQLQSDSEGEEVPDPYYSDEAAFEEVYGIVESCCDKMIDALEKLTPKK